MQRVKGISIHISIKDFTPSFLEIFINDNKNKWLLTQKPNIDDDLYGMLSGYDSFCCYGVFGGFLW